ncbi:MAG TPA: hypothetical protein VIH89_16610 [Candidatus Sulfotelmatobacter sp.]
MQLSDGYIFADYTVSSSTPSFINITSLQTAIPFLFRGKTIRAWGGPYKGAVEMDGSQWILYQAATFPTPPFPDYVLAQHLQRSGPRILELWTGSDFGVPSRSLRAVRRSNRD